ncbi:MAG: ATP-dependent Clp protease ATP-binding subunit [Candidatus Dojkabacteria bacterium]
MGKRNGATLDESQILDRFSDNARRAVIRSYDLARKQLGNSAKELSPSHLFAALLLEKNTLAAKVLAKLNLDLEKTAQAILGDLGVAKDSVFPNKSFRKIIGESFVEAARMGHVYVGTEHILLALMRDQELPFIREFLSSQINYERVLEEINQMGTYHTGMFRKGGLNSTGLPNNLDENRSESVLEHFGRFMNDMAKEGEYLPILGREPEIERVVNILSRKTKNNPILVGEPGVGKTAIVEGLVQRIVSGQIGANLKDLEVIQLDIAGIIAGAKMRGDIEERLLAIMEEAESDPNTILFIDEIHTLVGMSGHQSGADIINMIKPYLTSGKLQLIGATTYDEYRRYFEDEGALARRFQPVFVEELEKEAALQVLKFLKPNFEQYHLVTIEDAALKAAIELSSRYVGDRYLPDKAIDLIDEAAAKKKIMRGRKSTKAHKLRSDKEQVADLKEDALERGDLKMAGELRNRELSIQKNIAEESQKQLKKSTKFRVGTEDIRAVVSQWTKIPVNSLSAAELKTVSNIKTELKKQIIGQLEAADSLSASLQRAKLGLADEHRPLGSFLFLGPTGVGKTETAKVIARHMFGSEENLIQINMSEYMEQHTISKIIGAPPGYVGYSDGNHLSEQVRKNPHSVVLFDEIEKAHPDLLNVLLQILEEGELQDGKGRKVSFKNTVVILTSNIGAEEIAQDDTLGFNVQIESSEDKEREEAYEQMREQIMGELKDYLRPELVNRLDDIIVFRGLNEEDAKQIAQLQLEQVARRLEKQFIILEVTDAVKGKIGEEGFSTEYGARNIRRKIQEEIENKIAAFILENSLVENIAQLEKTQGEKGEPIRLQGKIKNGEVEITRKDK